MVFSSTLLKSEGIATHEVVTAVKRGTLLGVRYDEELGSVAP